MLFVGTVTLEFVLNSQDPKTEDELADVKSQRTD